MLTVGIKHSEKFIVLYEHTAKNIQSGGLEVLATPALIGFMEKCAWQSVLPMMNEGFDTVGISIDMKHLAPTPIGDIVKCESELIAIHNRELTFHITAHSNNKKIGETTHKRFIIQIDKFINKTII